MIGSTLTLAGKDLRLLFRDRFALFWIFAFPLMYCVFFGVLFGDSGDRGHARIAVAIVDEDQSPGSRQLAGRLAAHASLEVARQGEAADAPPATDSREAAEAAVRKGSKVAYVRIPAGYGSSPLPMFGGGAALEVGIDPARAAEAGFLQGILMETVFGGLGELFRDKEAMQKEVQRGIAEIARTEDLAGGQKMVLGGLMTALLRFFDEADPGLLERGPGGASMGDLVQVVKVARERGARPHSSFDITFPSAIVWGLMGVAVGFAITLVRERTQGTMLRLQVAPIGRAALLAGKALGCFSTCMIVMLCLLAFGVGALGVRIGSVSLALLAMACTAVCFTGLMMTAAVMGRTEQSVAGASWGVMMPFAMIGGGMIPLIAMPPWLLQLSNVSPFKWGIYALEGAIWRDFSPGDMALPCAILVGIGLVFFATGVAVFRRTAV